MKGTMKISKILQVKGSRVLLLIIFSTLVLIPLLAVNLPLSLVYSKVHSAQGVIHQAKALNTQRLEQAKHYFRELTSSSTTSLGDQDQRVNLKDGSSGGDLVICIITMDRSEQYQGSLGSDTGYLIQTMATVHSAVKHDNNFKNTTVFMCNVNTSPKSHRELSYMKDHVHVVEKYGSNSFNRNFSSVHGYVAQQKSVARGKEFEDYMFCLNASYTFQTPYILMLEDDVILEKDIFDVMYYALESHELALNDDLTYQRQFAYLKLYYPPRWQGYAFEVYRVVELFCAGFLGGTLLLIILSFIYKNTDNISKWIYFLTGTILTIYAVSLIGRQNIIELRRLSPQLYKFSPAPGCCTQAMLYPRYVVQQLISYLIEHPDMNKDLAISAFSREKNLPGYFLEPNLAYHVGMYTSLQRAYKPPEEFLSRVLLY